MEILFKDSKLKELNPVVLSKVMRLIRIDQNIKKTVLAHQLGVDRVTVFLIESGKRLPSLNYIYKFSKIFGINIDYLINYSLQ